MLKKKLGFIAVALVGLNMLTSCLFVNGPTAGKGSKGIDYTDYSNYSIKVRNDSSENVVCFMGTPSEDNLISGALASRTTGLKLDTELFSSSTDFTLFVVTEEDYLANRSNMKALENKAFTKVYAYYNKDAEQGANVVYTISKYLGGDSYILLNNMTKYNVELRENGLYGDALAYAGRYTTQTKLYVQPQKFEIFPVFRKFSSKTGEIMTSFPVYEVDGVEYPVFFQVELDNETKSMELHAEDWFDKDKTFNASETPCSAYIAIHNGNGGTGVSLYKGSLQEAATTSTGGKTINQDKTLTFEVPMVALGNNKYSTSATVSGWQIGTSGKRVTLDTVELNAGYMYYVEVSGSNYATIKAEWKGGVNNLTCDPVEIDWEE